MNCGESDYGYAESACCCIHEPIIRALLLTMIAQVCTSSHNTPTIYVNKKWMCAPSRRDKPIMKYCRHILTMWLFSLKLFRTKAFLPTCYSHESSISSFCRIAGYAGHLPLYLRLQTTRQHKPYQILRAFDITPS